MATIESSKFDKIVGSAGSASSLANGVAGLLDGIFGFSAKRQQKMQKQLMDLQNEQWKEQQQILANQQLEQWNRENEYNDPTNYFKRLMNGAETNGLSKAAVLGNMPGGSVGTSAQGVIAPGSTSPGSAGSPSLLNIGSANTLSNLRQRAEIANIEAQTAKLEQETTESGTRVDLNRQNRSLMQANEELVRNQALSENSRRVLYDLDADLKRLNVSNFDRITDAQVAEIWSKMRNYDASTANLEKEGKFIEANAEMQIKATRSQIALNSALYVVNKALAKKYGTETVGVSLDNYLKNATNSKMIEKLQKELQYYDFNQLKSLFSNTSSLIFALTNGVADSLFGNAQYTGLYQLMKSLYDSANASK